MKGIRILRLGETRRMFASFASRLAGPLIPGFLVMQSKASRVEEDLEDLLVRMRQRLYPETIPVLASYWLKTVYASGYGRRPWKKLNRLLTRVLGGQLPDGPSRQAIVDIQTWIQQMVLFAVQPPRPKPPQSERICATLGSDLAGPYINRLLNEWLPARLLVNGNASTLPRDDGIPPLAIGIALEGLLVRERLSPRALEMLLQPELISPHYVYPPDAEILQDVVLSLLGRTGAPPPSVMPAKLLYVGSDSRLPADYREAVHRAFLVRQPGGEEVHVPIAPAQAVEIQKDQQVRIGSVIVTMDGRWWEAENLQSGEQHLIVYRPVGRLRIEYSGGHARLRVPWLETRLNWSGGIPFPGTFEIFGREWHLSQWEQDAEHAWLHLMVSGVLPMTEIVPAGDARWWRLRPVSVDLAWSALENALTSSIVQRSREPIERLRHSDLIPLGRAIFGLAASLRSRRLQPYEAIETQLRGIGFLEAQVSPKYGRVPWRILPERVRESFFKIRSYPELVELLNQVFDSLPERLSAAASQAPRPGKASTFEFATVRRLTTFARDRQFLNWSERTRVKRDGLEIRS
jgi:hypothetical protein